MFKIFKKGTITKPQLTDAQICERAAAIRMRMGSKCCTAKNSTFKYNKEQPTVLIKGALL